jgi:DNA-binding transcriptional MerR regulator
MKMNRTFNIGALAKEGGVNVQTVRYYERIGLVLPIRRSTAGYRIFDGEALARLRFIRRAKELGFTLKEIGELLSLTVHAKTDCESAKMSVMAKLEAIDEKISSLESVRRVLGELLEACKQRKPTEDCPILKAFRNNG